MMNLLVRYLSTNDFKNLQTLPLSCKLIHYESVSERWLGWLRLLTADTLGLLGHVSLDSNVALLTPGGAPGVLDDPVVGLTFGTLTNKEDTMIKTSSAEVLDDSTEIELESERCAIDGNRNWSVLKSFRKGLWVLWSDILVADDLFNGSLSGAFSISALVWVVSFSVHHVSLGIVEGIVHKTAIAAHVALLFGAVNELLLRERWKLGVLHEVGTLH